MLMEIAMVVNKELPLIVNHISLKNLPVKDLVEEALVHDVVGEEYRAADSILKTSNKDLPHPTAAKLYFLQKIEQHRDLFTEVSNVNSTINKKLGNLVSYFHDSSTGSVKWSSGSDIVIFGGLNTGMKFSKFLEYYIMEVNKCPKAIPPYYELLYKQIEPYTVKGHVQVHVPK